MTRFDLDNLTVTNQKRTVIDTENVDMSDVLTLMDMLTDKDGIIRTLPYDEVKDVGKDTLNMVMQIMALYTFPTTEVVDFLREEIDDGNPEFAPDAIEICAGSGWIGRNLDIPITDSYLQDRQDVRDAYIRNGCVPIAYPKDVEKLDAIAAIKKYTPEFVIGSYVTRKWGLGSRKEGNMYGVDTGWVVNNCHKFYMIGNQNIHNGDPIMKRNHKEYSFPWLITRGDSTKARIWVWENKLWR